MLEYTESYGKFFAKRGATVLRSFLLRAFRTSVRTQNWHERMLFVNLEGIGDLIMFTSILKHYRKRFPEKKIYLLIKKGSGVERIYKNDFAEDVILLDYRKFSVNPFYGFAFLNRLRRIGFQTVVNYDFSASEIMGKIITVSVGAENVIGYEGQRIEFEKPYDPQQAKHIEIARKEIFPRYTRIIPGIAQNEEDRLPNEIEHYRVIYEATTGFREEDYAPVMPFPDPPERIEEIVERFGLTPRRYVLMNVNSSVACKLWPLSRFAALARFLRGEGFVIALVGSKKERPHNEGFEKLAGGRFHNLAGMTSFHDLIALAANAFIVVTNDTSTVHLAVALKIPSLCVAGGGQFGVAIDYGYKDIHIWAYERTPCYLDNWRCARKVAHGKPSPCVEAVSLELAMGKLKSLLEYLRNTPAYPREPFRIRF